jgi:hypothetical protein
MRSGLQEISRLLRVWSQVKIGEKDLAWPKPRALDRLRFLDLDDKFRNPENQFRSLAERRAGVAICGVVYPRAAFDDDFVAVLNEFGRRGRDETYSIFIVLDFLRHADSHESSRCRGIVYWWPRSKDVERPILSCLPRSRSRRRVFNDHRRFTRPSEAFRISITSSSLTWRKSA